MGGEERLQVFASATIRGLSDPQVFNGVPELAQFRRPTGQAAVQVGLKSQDVVRHDQNRRGAPEQAHDLGPERGHCRPRVRVGGHGAVKVRVRTGLNLAHHAVHLIEPRPRGGSGERVQFGLEGRPSARELRRDGGRDGRGGGGRGGRDGHLGTSDGDGEGKGREERSWHGVRIPTGSPRRHARKTLAPRTDLRKISSVPRPRLTASLVSVLLALSVTGASAAPPVDGDRVLLTLEGPGTPFQRVQMEAKVRGASVVVRLTQSFGAPYGERDAVGLSTPAELEALIGELEAAGLFAVPPTPKANTGVTADSRHRLEVQVGGRKRVVQVTNPERLADRRYQGLLKRVRTWIVTITGEPSFVDGRMTPDESGFLHLETRPSGRVFVDEVLLSESTPIDALRLPLGAHVLRIVAADGRVERTLDITIEKGKTTSLRMNLE